MCGSRLSSGRRGSILGQILKKLLEGLGGARLGEGVQDHIHCIYTQRTEDRKVLLLPLRPLSLHLLMCECGEWVEEGICT